MEDVMVQRAEQISTGPGRHGSLSKPMFSSGRRDLAIANPQDSVKKKKDK
jgi:hypothetical protein